MSKRTIGPTTFAMLPVMLRGTLLAALLVAASPAHAETFPVDSQTFAARMQRAGYPVTCVRGTRTREANCALGGVKFAFEGDQVAGVIAAEWPWAERGRLRAFAVAFVGAVGGSAADQAATARIEGGDTIRGRPVTVHGWSAGLRGVRCCTVASVSVSPNPRLEIWPREPDEVRPDAAEVGPEVARLRAFAGPCALAIDEARLGGFLVELGLSPGTDPGPPDEERARDEAIAKPGGKARLCNDLKGKFGETGTLLQGVVD